MPLQSDPRVLVDYRTADDAGVYQLEGGPALVQTIDFFTPIVDDPYVYGEIAAANALSDVYAMGGRPITALAVAAFPSAGLDERDIAAIFRGGFDTLQAAGVALLGGHTVQDREIKFGYAVTGIVAPERLLTNAGARAGDALLLTKPIGTGIVGTAIKFGRADAGVVAAAVESMRTLNRDAARIVGDVDGVHACTDITGFGLAGHGSEMARASGVSLRLTAAAVPLLPGVAELAAEHRSGGLSSNRDHFLPGVEFGPGVTELIKNLVFDPQTSGGLLVAVAPAKADCALARLREAGIPAVLVGAAEAKGASAISFW